MPPQRFYETTRFRVCLGMLVWLLSVLVSLKPVPHGEVALSWAFVPVSSLTVALLWQGHGWPGRKAWALIATMLGTMWLGGFVQGLGAFEVTWIAFTQVVATTIVLKLYAWLIGSATAPFRSTRDLLVMVLAAVTAVGVSGLMGGFPGMAGPDLKLFGGLSWNDPQGWLWMARSLTFTLVGLSTFQFIYHGSGYPEVRPKPSKARIATLCVAGPALVYVALTNLEFPLTWLLLIPAVWAGTILTPVWTATYSMGLGVFINALTYFPVYTSGLTWVPLGSIIDILVAVACLIGIQVSLVSTERARALARARASRKRSHEQAILLGHVFDSMSDGLAVINSTGEVTRQNTALGRLVRSDAAGPGFTAAPGKILREQVLKLSDDQTLRLFSDVTDERSRLDELQELARLVAHDLQAPLNHLNDRVDLAVARASHTGPSVAAMLRKADAAGDRMDQVLADWLQTTVHSDGSLVISAAPLMPLVREVATHHAAARITVQAPHVVEANEAMVRQVLANVISNSVKYTPPDRTPEIQVTSAPHHGSGWIRVEIRDNGIGLVPGEEHKIFEEFHRSPGAAQHFEGTGVGLATCRRIIERHGGQIWATNNDNKIGATLTFTLPGAPVSSVAS